MSDKTLPQVTQFLSQKTGISETAIGETDELVANLGLDGDDAAEFFERLGAEFETDLTALQAKWDRHFRSEPTLLDIFRRWRVGTLIPITVKDVARAVDSGEWPVS